LPDCIRLLADYHSRVGSILSARRLNTAARMTVAGLMLALWLTTLALSISPALHRCLHSDSASGKHECLVTCFAGGQILSGASTGVLVSVNGGCFIARPWVVPTYVSQPEYRLAASRAPPASPLPRAS